MTLEARCLDRFPAWLHAFPDDARALAGVLEGDPSDGARRWAAVALTYLFKSLDLIPDGLEDLGYIDDAFVMRVAAAQVPEAERGEESAVLARLAADAELIREFLGESYSNLESYVRGLTAASAKGRSVAEIGADVSVAAEFVHEVREWADGYAVPGFSRDAKTLVKLRSFLETKLAGAAT